MTDHGVAVIALIILLTTSGLVILERKRISRLSVDDKRELRKRLMAQPYSVHVDNFITQLRRIDIELPHRDMSDNRSA